MKVSYAPTRHHAFDQVFPTVLRDGEAVVFTDWKALRR
jgi:hypothetical protein